MPLFVKEKNWSSNPEENAQYQRLANAWNAIHRAMLAEDNACATTEINGGVFFRFNDELLLCDAFSTDDLINGAPFDQVYSLFDFSGQGIEDLRQLADSMEKWLERPAFYDIRPGRRISEHPSLKLRLEHPEFAEKYLEKK